MPVFLRLERPFLFPQKSADQTRKLIELLIGAAIPNRERVRVEAALGEARTAQGFVDIYGPDRFQRLLRSQGYDGIIAEGNVASPPKRETEFLVFEPVQIKSAIANRGTFARTDPNVLREEQALYGGSVGNTS
jgi:hypothetical protein